MTYTFTFQQLADAIPTLSEDDHETWFELDDDVFPTYLDRIDDYIGCARDTTMAELANRGLIVDFDAKTVTVADADAMSKAEQLTSEICYEYDGTKDPTDVPTAWWKTLGLGGDDDVDYNSSYLDAIWLILNHLLPEDYRTRELPGPRYDDYHTA